MKKLTKMHIDKIFYQAGLAIFGMGTLSVGICFLLIVSMHELFKFV